MGSITREHALQQENRRLRAALDEALEREAQLEAALRSNENDRLTFARVFKLSPQMAALLATLMKREQCSLDALIAGLPRMDLAADGRDDVNGVRVQIHRLRRALELHGIAITSVRSLGCFLTSADKAKVWRAVEAAKGGDT